MTGFVQNQGTADIPAPAGYPVWCVNARRMRRFTDALVAREGRVGEVLADGSPLLGSWECIVVGGVSRFYPHAADWTPAQVAELGGVAAAAVRPVRDGCSAFDAWSRYKIGADGAGAAIIQRYDHLSYFDATDMPHLSYF